MSTNFSQPEMSSFDLQNPYALSQSPSIASLRIPHHSVSATAATSMLTVCPADDEKDYVGMPGPSGSGEGQESGGDGEAGIPAVEPQIPLTFLLISGDRRTMAFDPETTVGRVKELVWNAWPSDWPEEKPSAPSFLRILYLGKILQDEDTLSTLLLPSLHSSPIPITSLQTQSFPTTIVHLSVRPYAPPVEDEASLKKKVRAARRALSRSASTAQPPQATARADGPDVARVGGCCGCIIC